MGSDCGGGEDAEESLGEKLEDMTDLGRLEQVDNISTVWPHEAHDFTPWLAKNMDLLSDAVGIPLTLDGAEVYVGDPRLDMLAHTVDGSAVLIENQYGKSDDTHLGSLLTYSAGLERRNGLRVKTVIWIAEDFYDYHLDVIRWLNERTPDSVVFLPVRIRLVKIGDSQPAPVFDVIDAIERPTKWDRRKEDIVWRSGLSDRQRSHLSFWSYYAKRYPDDGVPAGHTRGESRCRVEGSEVDIGLALYGGQVGIGFPPDNTEQAFAQLTAREDSIRARLGVEFEDASGWWWYQRRNGDWAKEDRQEIAEWIHQRLVEYRGALTDDE